jgi:hypothetical protein
MQHSDQPFEELEGAREEVAGMAAARSVAEFERHWKEFSRRLERSWNKTKAHFGKSPKWGGWQARFHELRQADPLLSYLVNARGAEEHTVSEIVGRKPGSISINPAEGNALYIERLEVDRGVLSVKSPQKLKVEFVPATMTLVPVVNRGRTYGLPTSHLGSPTDPSNVGGIAEFALKFYEDVLAQAEEFLVKRPGGPIRASGGNRST